MREDRATHGLLGLGVLVFAPVLGLAVMLGVWSVVDSDGAGAIDYGVLVAGSLAASLPVAVAARLFELPWRHVALWTALAFTAALAAGFLAVLSYIDMMNDLASFD